MLTLRISRSDVVGVVRAVEACFLGLFRGKKAPLGYRDGGKSGLGLLGRTLHDHETLLRLRSPST
jgi:hypothetical protein